MISYCNSIDKLLSILDEIEAQKKSAKTEGEICALSCLDDSIKSRIEYLEDFKDEDEPAKQIEFRCELKGLINLMENEINRLTSSKFDFDFLKVYMHYLKALKEISNQQ